MHTFKSKTHKQTALYILCLVLMPFVLIFYQYQRNIEHLAFWHVLILSGAIALLLIGIFFISKLILKTNIGAFVFAGFFILSSSILWSLFETSIRWLRVFIPSLGFSTERVLLLAGLFGFLVIAVVFTFCFIGYKRSEKFAAMVKRLFRRTKGVLIITGSILLLLAVILAFIFFDDRFDGNHYARTVFIALIIFVYALMHLLFLHKLRDSSKVKYVAPFISVMLGVMLIMSSISIITFAAEQETDDVFFKDSWNVTEPLDQQPNIYWLHVDGMLGFDAMWRFFGEEQNELVEALENRGFWISRYASFVGGNSTSTALPALMNPHFYDRVLSWGFDSAWAESIPANEHLLDNPSLRLSPNFTSLRTARERNETILAFNAAGFNTSTIASLNIYFYPIVNQFYCSGSSDKPLLTTTRSVEETLEFVNNIANLQNLFDLTNDVLFFFPSSINRGIFNTRQMFANMIEDGFTRSEIEHSIDFFAGTEIPEATKRLLRRYDLTANILMDIFEHPEPRFVTFMTTMHHTNWVFDEAGNYKPENAENNPSRYAAHHAFCANIVLMLVDIILEHDPGAVIVWQADHGLHWLLRANGIDAIMEYFNCTAEEAEALWHSTASAIRLPGITGGGGILDEDTVQILSDPRNISRFLVNNFVGQNYDYIPPEFRQVFLGPER